MPRPAMKNTGSIGGAVAGYNLPAIKAVGLESDPPTATMAPVPERK